MTKKSMMLGVTFILVIAVITALSAAYGGFYLSQKAAGNEEGVFSSLFSSSKAKETDVHFVNIRNVVITLGSASHQDTEHYLLLDLALTTKDEASIERIDRIVPLVQSSTVNLLTNMSYQDVRKMTVMELRQQLLTEYQKDFTQLKMDMPFVDVLISKMVFQ